MEDSLHQGYAKLEDPAQVDAGLQELDDLLMDLCSLPADMTGRGTSRSRSGYVCTQILDKDEVRHFLALQDNPMYNMASRLLVHIQIMLRDPRSNIKRITKVLDMIQGCCLLHYPSRRIFSTPKTMGILIECLKLDIPDKIQIAAINTIVSCMVREVANIRQFEKLDGIATICALFKNKDTPKDVKLRILEFLFFYLVPETATARVAVGTEVQRKTTADKQAMLGKYLSNVNGLVRELHMSKPFGSMNHEW